ncbi:MAG TPA: 2-succinyl-5-enolpyruvyl-6-hydroxy-3-cyclohexene-1-carboxylic-acid synthase [Acidimicrobiia bacterium]|nr:2-succinyl-5-enolpyruvyl-6-hydroxy-3-cyclohexene-1-carboxylic-acid synthase [Acidimicrobiia bacterium]
MTADLCPPVTAEFAATVVDEWVRGGVTDAVVAPGSRSAPLALALARNGRIRVHVVVDERSAAFLALGIGRESRRPAVVCCTSGTAGAHFHPAVMEADLAGVPLLVCTANRPPELLDTGAGQTVEQHHLFGGAVRWFAAPGPPIDLPDAGAVWRAVAARAVAETLGPPAGPVHLDLAFREPLVTDAHAEPRPGRTNGAPWTATSRAQRRLADDDIAALARRLRRVERGIVVAGWGADVEPETATGLASRLGWPLLADPVSGLRVGPHAISTYDALLRVAPFATAHRPDLVLRLGAPLTSKVATAWLDPNVPQILVDPDARWLDPHRAASDRVGADAEPLLRALLDAFEPARVESSWLASWRAAERAARTAIDTCLDGDDTAFDARVARDVYEVVPDGGALLVASSLPVRELEWFARPRAREHSVRVHANRGANGIDGLVSTTLGIAAARTGPTVALLGDLAWLHDSNGLLAARDLDRAVTFVVLDNGGGGIFHFLPAGGLAEREQLFTTPAGVDPVALAAAYGIDARRVERAAAVAPAVEAALAAGGVRVVVVPTDRETTVARHDRLWQAVAEALTSPS